MPKSRDDFFIGHEETYTDRRIKIHIANEKLAKFGVTSFSLPFMKILLSSCLLGINTQWNEDCKKIGELVELVKSGKAVFMCPEQAGGLPTPREHSEIEQGRTAKDVLKGRGEC